MKPVATLFASVVLGLSAGGAGAEGVAPVQSYDSYGSWLVACDNGLACLARGFAQDGERIDLTVAREAGPAGALSLRLAADAPFTAADLRLDDAPLALDPADWTVSAEESGTVLASRRPEAARALVKVLRDGTTLSSGAAGDVPLDGFTAAMLRIDERQGRLRTATALIRTGPRSELNVPQAPQLPEVAGTPAAAAPGAEEARRLAARVGAEQAGTFEAQGCEADRLALGPDVYALDEAQALLLFPCLMGAYQGSSLGFLTERASGRSRLLVLPVPYGGNDPGERSQTLLTEGDFDPATGMLWMAARGRGLGDCGMTARWAWDHVALRLAELTLQQRCGGHAAGDWPVLFRSRE